MVDHADNIIGFAAPVVVFAFAVARAAQVGQVAVETHLGQGFGGSLNHFVGERAALRGVGVVDDGHAAFGVLGGQIQSFQLPCAGDVIEGKVKRLTDFGAFVEVLPGIDGLVHISQISHKRVENPKDVLSVGQDVTVKVLDVNTADERVSLSIKALEERPAQDESNGEKRQSRPRRQKRQDKRDYELPETQTGFSMADLFGDIEL